MVRERCGSGEVPEHLPSASHEKLHTAVDANVGMLVNWCLPIAKGERGQLREYRGMLPGGLSSDSKEVLAMSIFARPISNYPQCRLPWGIGITTIVPPRGVLR